MHGNVGNLLLGTKTEPTAVFACGSNGLLKTVEQLFSSHQNVQLSLESRMACGIGLAMLAFVIRRKMKQEQKV